MNVVNCFQFCNLAVAKTVLHRRSGKGDGCELLSIL